MEIDLLELWSHMNNLVRGVVIVLTIQAIGCITVTVDRLLMLRSSNKKSRLFAQDVSVPMEKGDYEGVIKVAGGYAKKSHLARFIELGVKTFHDHLVRGLSREKASNMTQRALERHGENLSTDLNKGMNVLASTGSTAPFVGLLGTVLGILNAFKLIGETGSGGLGTIGAAIGEALVVTGYGLMVAIPAVLLFNWLSARIAKYEAGLANAGSELLDQLESGSFEGGVAPSQTIRPPERSLTGNVAAPQASQQAVA